MQDIEELRPHCPFYGATMHKLEQFKIYSYCRCGLSSSFECDNSCDGTAFKPLEFMVTKNQAMFSICRCRYSKSLPFCDATHIHLPLEYVKRQEECIENHNVKLCSNCGFANKDGKR